MHGLLLARDRPPFYVRLLRIFLEHHASDPQRLRQAAQHGDTAAIQGIAHVLKGTAGSIGATRVCGLAESMLAALHREDGAAPGLAPALADGLEHLLGELRHALDGRDPEQGP